MNSSALRAVLVSLFCVVLAISAATGDAAMLKPASQDTVPAPTTTTIYGTSPWSVPSVAGSGPAGQQGAGGVPAVPPQSPYRLAPQPVYVMPPQGVYGAQPQAVYPQAQMPYATQPQTGYQMPPQTGYTMPPQTGYPMPPQAGYPMPAQTGYQMPSQTGIPGQALPPGGQPPLMQPPVPQQGPQNLQTFPATGTVPFDQVPAESMPAFPADVADISPVERQMADDAADDLGRARVNAVGGVRQFGYSYFRGRNDGFAPLSDIPVGPEYLVGTGDRIVLTTWGSVEGSFELEVNRSGEISLPKVGTVKVQGVSFGQLPGLLKNALGRVFKDFQLSVTLGRTRLMRVYIVGDVAAPGDYTISSFATVISALSVAGGPTRSGSLRNIQLKRGGKLVETIDLYDFFLKGDKSRDIRLQAGDTVFVPPIGRVAGIAGNVRRPAIYELKDEKSLKELIDLASGITTTGYLQRLQVNRVDAHAKRVVADFNIDPARPGDTLDTLAAGITIQDHDLVKVFHIDTKLRGYVRLTGYLLRPGDYALRPGMKVGDILTKDLLLPEYAEESAELVRLVPPDLHPEVSFFNPAKAVAGDPAQNFGLQEFDQIRLFSRWDLEEMPRVRISGEIQRPGDYRFMKNMTVRELVLQAGNPKLTAYLAKAELVRTRRDGQKVTSFQLPVNLGEALSGSPKENLVLEPLDELIIRRIPNWLEETERYATIRGEVQFPGTYPIFKGERLASLIERAGGYTDKAYLFGARFTRSSVQKIQQERMDDAMARAEKNIVMKEQEVAAAASSKDEVAATKLALEGLRSSMEKMKKAKAEGRVAIKLSQLDELRRTHYNLELQGGDTLEIPQSNNAVTVIGEVANTTSTVWLPGKDVAYYLDMAGGPTDGAETGEMYVIMADGNVRGKMSDGAFSFLRSDGFMATRLHPGDTVVVPQKLERVSWMKELKDITQILGNLAVTAGVPLAVIKK